MRNIIDLVDCKQNVEKIKLNDQFETRRQSFDYARIYLMCSISLAIQIK